MVDSYEVQNDGQIVVCHLTILGVTRCDVGEDDSPGGDDDRGPKNKATTSAAQAFKRACVKFGLGAYLYRLPRIWAPYDPVKKQFPEEGLALLSRALGTPAPKKASGGNGDRPKARRPIKKPSALLHPSRTGTAPMATATWQSRPVLTRARA